MINEFFFVCFLELKGSKCDFKRHFRMYVVKGLFVVQSVVINTP